MTPRISAIMPTANRRRFVPSAIAAFLAQGREDAELVILDDGADSVADLIPGDPRIRYHREDAPRVIGDKRNRLCALAQGEIIVHWDDDDWHAPDRLARQLAAIEETGADIVGLDRIAFLSDDGREAWDYQWQGRGHWVYGASLAFRRAFWARHPFPAIRAGEDTRFVLDAGDAHVHAMPDRDWLVARVHAGNTSPKRTTGGYWHPRGPGPLLERIAGWSASPPPLNRRALNNVYALLAHERPECVIDLVRNLRFHDPASPILLYDGSAQGTLVDRRLPWARWGVEIVPDPRPMRWGVLHGFALDCIAHLGARDYDTLTIVDSDQAMLRRDYPGFLGAHLDPARIGVLSSDPRPQDRYTRVPPAHTAQSERALWQPFLNRFPNGDDCFVRWTFWPGTVIGAEAGRAIAALFDDAQLRAILAASRLWATEEILFPTLAALLGLPVTQNPCQGAWTQYRRPWTVSDLDAAMANPQTFWMHPVNRRPDDPLRRALRERCNHYRSAAPAPLAQPAVEAEQIMATMRAIPGWLDDREARALLDCARATPPCGHIVEIGSYCGKATFLLGQAARDAQGRVTAIDRFDGVTGSRDDRITRDAATRIRFDQMIAANDLAEWVAPRTGEASEVATSDPVDLLVIDGFHDYPAVAMDFAAFEAALTPAARVAFHDYADYFPGVMAFVDELVAAGDWEVETAVETLRILRRTGLTSLLQNRRAEAHA
ncbi:MAG TPA: glycosyltransferase [Phenylobacterium sp.]|nr:glycosyltransferase [Phenylobacterium sp.]